MNEELLSVFLGIKITPTLDKQLRKAAEAERRTLSNFVRVKLEQAVSCPTCDGKTTSHPDNLMAESGVRYCTRCDEPVLDQEATG